MIKKECFTRQISLHILDINFKNPFVDSVVQNLTFIALVQGVIDTRWHLKNPLKSLFLGFFFHCRKLNFWFEKIHDTIYFITDSLKKILFDSGQHNRN